MRDAGYATYLVGGCVRDLLLGRKPKDFDVATEAHPEKVRKLFSNCRLIGRRFRLAHIHFGRDIIEVATFRAAHTETSEHGLQSQDGLILRDNVYGDVEEDAWRRDFTINALYYNIDDFSVIDYCGGMADLANKTIRLIGDPAQRYREDPVRILRAVRFAGKLNFTIHPETEAPITTCKELLLQVPAARLFEEILKLFQSGHSLETFELLRKYELFGLLFSQTHALIGHPQYPYLEKLVKDGFKNTDNRIQVGKHINPAFLFAVLLWYPLQQQIRTLEQEGFPEFSAWESALNSVLAAQLKQISIPKRLTAIVREMWYLQPRLEKRDPKRIYRLLEQPRFRAAYDLLVLRANVGEIASEMASWWTAIQDANVEERKALIAKLGKTTKPRRKRKKPKKKDV